jgi:GTP-binding protein
VRLDGDRSFVVADVPGLVEGAHRGLGLGHQFLRHIERTKVLVYMVDVSSGSGREPADDLAVIRRELELFQAGLLARPQVVAATKIDAVDDADRVDRLRAAAAERRLPFFPISAVTGQGVPALLEALWRGMTPVAGDADEDA